MPVIKLSSEEDDLYGDIIQRLSEIKLTLGPNGLASTLRRHSEIKNFIIQYQKDSLKNFEGRLADLFN